MNFSQGKPLPIPPFPTESESKSWLWLYGMLLMSGMLSPSSRVVNCCFDRSLLLHTPDLHLVYSIFHFTSVLWYRSAEVLPTELLVVADTIFPCLGNYVLNVINMVLQISNEKCCRLILLAHKFGAFSQTAEKIICHKCSLTLRRRCQVGKKTELSWGDDYKLDRTAI